MLRPFFKSKAKLILKWRAGLETKDTNQLDAMQRDFDELMNGIFAASVVRLPLPLNVLKNGGMLEGCSAFGELPGDRVRE